MDVAYQTPEGSSVVWVQHADALGEEDERDAAGCFALLTAKVTAYFSVGVRVLSSFLRCALLAKQPCGFLLCSMLQSEGKPNHDQWCSLQRPPGA
jgi:hypothetical protein